MNSYLCTNLNLWKIMWESIENQAKNYHCLPSYTTPRIFYNFGMMKKVIFIQVFTIVFCMISSAQSFIDKDSLFVQSKRENKNVLMLFSGSDWCPNCLRFERNVFKDSVFQNFLHDNLLYLNVDFPQRKKQPEVLKKQNELLAEMYNPDGVFPTLLLFSSDKKMIRISYQQENALQYIDKIKKALFVLKEQNGAQN